uniref:Uncharacterized protein n=1 Tax=Sphaerodactylus townsendi TaxID=933632 RepID=A0ACB8F0V1_9SAUR
MSTQLVVQESVVSILGLLWNLSKKYQPKKNSKEEDEYKYSSCKAFLATLNEMNDYAGQHEVVSENMTSQITTELARYVQELKQERKLVCCDEEANQMAEDGSQAGRPSPVIALPAVAIQSYPASEHGGSIEPSSLTAITEPLLFYDLV